MDSLLLDSSAERLDIDRVCTYDRRDFAITRPAHRDFLTLLP
jgi:hypothetical protein